jgi:hypothetical protein
VVGSAWICQLYDLECCLGSHTLKWPVGVLFIATNQIVAVGEGCWRGAPPCHPIVRAWSWSTVGGFVVMRHRTVWCHTGQSGAPLTFCSDFCRVTMLHCSSIRADRCAQIAIAPLVHQTVWWYTGQSGEL